MCEFCVKHGEGKKWYLNAKNYSQDLASDVRRRKTTDRVFQYFDDGLAKDFERMETLFPKLPKPLKRIVSTLVTAKQKREHFGQVVPIEDVERILKIVSSVVRIPCACRQTILGREVRYCLGISVMPHPNSADHSYANGPEANYSEKLSNPEALSFMRKLEEDGIVHSIWTFGTPFVGAICNCDRADCVAMRSTVKHGIQVMFRAEYVAFVDKSLCTGCKQCLRLCQFGAMGFSTADKKAYIDEFKCYGCGVCRTACPNGAIVLRERAEIPAVANLW